ncbi:hypothetical protein [Desulfoluna spongiiphila]|uniref:Uncharacterized protein n=1 Tax=Desulfoluna spongiiphila TaxID=419481 RepID=A0A1G5HCR5_9BACT|nr:hypothetical protein [Desulfoluna spongiiphila]SCY61662.1 hypothetical protein SAMN05216233_113107 [Desulfoluna spongiiphila]VVS94638.1 hypothetical protein DBB_42100 [Desulfoluna spongiiphila]
MADSTWDGLLLRTSLSDDGSLPRKVTSSSPDVICSGSVPPDNPEQYVDPANYSNGYSNKIFNNVSNYFYIRAKNISSTAQEKYLHAYWAQSNLILLPSIWKDNYMRTSSNADGVKVKAENKGDIVANTEDAFRWEPTTPDPDTHYCIVAQASDSIDPSEGVPEDNFESAAAWSDWLAQRGNWAWRNTVYVASDSPDLTQTTGHKIQIPGDPVDPPHLYNLYIKCTNVPVGWSFQFTSGTVIELPPGYDNPVDTLTKPKADVTNPNDNIGGHWYLPAQFMTNISVSVWFNGIPPNSDTKWQLKINEVTDDDTLSLYTTALPIMMHDEPHPKVLEWLAHNELHATSRDIPIGKEVECGNINFDLV